MPLSRYPTSIWSSWKRLKTEATHGTWINIQLFLFRNLLTRKIFPTGIGMQKTAGTLCPKQVCAACKFYSISSWSLITLWCERMGGKQQLTINWSKQSLRFKMQFISSKLLWIVRPSTSKNVSKTSILNTKTSRKKKNVWRPFQVISRRIRGH